MRANSQFRADVEGLRAVAVLAVVAYHAGLGGVGGGFVGVDVFYVLSGFLITGLLWEELERTGRLRLGAFYGRRARRLLPAAALVLVVTLVASSLWLSPLQVPVVAGDAATAALYVANYRFAAQRTDYLADASPSPLQHYWSLGVEEQFYLPWPLLLVGVVLAGRRLGMRSRAVAAAALVPVEVGSFALSLRLTAVSQPWAFFSLPTRAWELAAGGLVALAAPKLRRLPEVAAATLGWLGLEAILWSITRLGPSTPFPGTAALFPVGGTAAVVAAGCAAPRLGPSLLLGRWPLQLGGRLSYAWYLWHWPLLILAPGPGRPCPWPVDEPRPGRRRRRARPGHREAGRGPGAVLAPATGTPRSQPDPGGGPDRDRGGGRPRGGQLSPIPQGRGVAAAPAAIRTVPPTRPKSTKPQADPAEARLTRLSQPVLEAVATAARARTVPANLDPPLASAHGGQPRPVADGCLIRWQGVTSGPCRYGSTSSRGTVVLFGDSHALQWFPALDRATLARRWQLVSLTKTTCPPVALSFWSPVLGGPYRECDQWRANMLTRIRAERPSVVVLGAARHYGDVYHFKVYGQPWISGLASMVRQVQAAGAKVVVLGPTPKPRVDVPDCLAEHLRDATACTTPRAVAVNAAGLRAERRAVLAAGGA